MQARLKRSRFPVSSPKDVSLRLTMSAVPNATILRKRSTAQSLMSQPMVKTICTRGPLVSKPRP